MVIFVTFIPTAVISYLYLRRTLKDPNILAPWLGKATYAAPSGMETGLTSNKDPVWNTDTADIDDHHNHRPDSAGTDRGGHQEEDEYQLLHGADTDHGHHPARHWNGDHGQSGHGGRYGDVEEDTSYQGAYGESNSQVSSSMTLDGYPSEFPSAPYGYNGPRGR